MKISEFKAWLEGAEELQPEDWVPSESQWKRIRAKIDEIDEPEPAVEYRTQQPAPPQQPVMDSPPPVVNNNPPPGPPPGVDFSKSALDDNTNMTAAAAAALNGNLPEHGSDSPPMVNLGSQDRLKTQDIDTSDGNYGSAFE